MEQILRAESKQLALFLPKHLESIMVYIMPYKEKTADAIKENVQQMVKFCLEKCVQTVWVPDIGTLAGESKYLQRIMKALVPLREEANHEGSALYHLAASQHKSNMPQHIQLRLILTAPLFAGKFSYELDAQHIYGTAFPSLLQSECPCLSVDGTLLSRDFPTQKMLDTKKALLPYLKGSLTSEHMAAQKKLGILDPSPPAAQLGNFVYCDDALNLFDPPREPKNDKQKADVSHNNDNLIGVFSDVFTHMKPLLGGSRSNKKRCSQTAASKKSTTTTVYMYPKSIHYPGSKHIPKENRLDHAISQCWSKQYDLLLFVFLVEEDEEHTFASALIGGSSSTTTTTSTQKKTTTALVTVQTQKLHFSVVFFVSDTTTTAEEDALYRISGSALCTAIMQKAMHRSVKSKQTAVPAFFELTDFRTITPKLTSSLNSIRSALALSYLLVRYTENGTANELSEYLKANCPAHTLLFEEPELATFFFKFHYYLHDLYLDTLEEMVFLFFLLCAKKSSHLAQEKHAINEIALRKAARGAAAATR
jgi:hypothetical protein